MYLDNSATTPLNPKVKEYIVSILDDFANPSSTTEIGMKSKQLIETARENVAKFINANSEDIIFTSSGSAANTAAICGLSNDKSFFYYSPTCHKSMRLACESRLHNAEIKVNKQGFIDLFFLETLLKLCTKRPVICIEAANSEIGTVQDLKAISNLATKYNATLILDCTGYVPTIKLDVQAFNNNTMCIFSAHKLGALKGVGVLYKPSLVKIKPCIYGKQEQGIFGGTENVIGISALGKAVEVINYSLIKPYIRDYLYAKILNNVKDCYLVGSLKERTPYNLYMCFKGIRGSSLVTLLDGDDIQVSTGSACNNGDKAVSPALRAIEVQTEDIDSCIRFSLNGTETIEDIDFVVDRIKHHVESLRFLVG